jgi:hypothetical protein
MRLGLTPQGFRDSIVNVKKKRRCEMSHCRDTAREILSKVRDGLVAGELEAMVEKALLEAEARGRSRAPKMSGPELRAHQMINCHFGGSNALEKTYLDCYRPLDARVYALLGMLSADAKPGLMDPQNQEGANL